MKIKDLLYIILGVGIILCTILEFKTIAIEYGSGIDPLLTVFRLLFIFWGLTLIATGAGNIADAKKDNTPTPPPYPFHDEED